MTITRKEIVEGLLKLGLKKGNIVLLHSALSSIGKVEGGADTVIDAFLKVLGTEGTLVVPSFSEKLGIITRTLKERPEAVTSFPAASVSAIGAKAEEICERHWKAETAHGEGTPYLKIADMGGYICLLGVDQDRNTTLHSVEALLRLPYLRQEGAPVTFSTPDGEITKSFKYLPGPHRDFINLDSLLLNNGIMKIGKLGNAVTRLIKSREMIDICVEKGKNDPAFVLCENPECSDCIRQKSELIRERLSREEFTLVASSLLAGYYEDEIVDNIKKAGLNAIEIDFIKGKPVDKMKIEELSSFVTRLRNKDIEPVSIRINCLDYEKIETFLELASDTKIPRITAPLAPDYPDKIFESAGNKNISLSLFNTASSSDRVSEILIRLKNAKLAFRPTGFAEAGEFPFRTSYKKKLKNFIDQIYIEDALVSGKTAKLAHGHAEIKELISILRCSSFAGYMVLGSKNCIDGNLSDAVKSLIKLLNSM